jgi:hypothetical protein
VKSTPAISREGPRPSFRLRWLWRMVASQERDHDLQSLLHRCSTHSTWLLAGRACSCTYQPSISRYWSLPSRRIPMRSSGSLIT